MTPARPDRCDAALLAAFALCAVLGTWNSALLINDGAFLLSPGWLGNAWDLYFNQIAERAVSVFIVFGPAWGLRVLLGLSSGAYIALAHLLYFGALLALWFAIFKVEAARIFSRLYLAIVLALIYFPTEYLVGIGLWMIWMATIAGPGRARRAIVIATLCFAPILAFAHPANVFISVIYLVVGGAATLAGRPFPRQTLLPAAAMAAFVLAIYFVTATLMPASNPTIIGLHQTERFNYVDLFWMIDTLRIFPMLAALWLLLVLPGLQRGYMPVAIVVIGLLGLWFAANGTSLLTYLFARHSAPHVLGLALALALTAPAAQWLTQARLPLLLYAGVVAVAGVSYNIDLALFGRFVDQNLRPGIVDVDKLGAAQWPRQQVRTWPSLRTYFKWAAGADYVRDVVMPDYQQYQHALAYYTFFRSNRQSVMFHEIPGGYWLPYECPAVARALAHARDDLDRRFIAFLGEHYCVRTN